MVGDVLIFHLGNMEVRKRTICLAILGIFPEISALYG